jgi:hypothetical protein
MPDLKHDKEHAGCDDAMPDILAPDAAAREDAVVGQRGILIAPPCACGALKRLSDHAPSGAPPYGRGQEVQSMAQNFGSSR